MDFQETNRSINSEEIRILGGYSVEQVLLVQP